MCAFYRSNFITLLDFFSGRFLALSCGVTGTSMRI